MKCKKCGGEAHFHKTYGDDYYEQREDVYLCEKCNSYISDLD